MAVNVFRVVVRGEFADLTSDQREALLAEAEEHDIFRSAFTTDGTFTYDRRLVAFNLRYEIRLDVDLPLPQAGLSFPESQETQAVAVAMEHALTDLSGWGLSHKRLRASAADMSEMWRA